MINDIAMVVTGWVLGLFTLPITKDSEVKEKCLTSLTEIKRLLEELSKSMCSPTRSEERYYELLIKIKPVMERLNIEKTGLLFPSYSLNDLLQHALNIYKKLNPEHEHPALYITFSAVRLMTSWAKDTHEPNFDELEKIQKFISKTFLKRSLEWLYSLIKRNRRYDNTDELPF